MEAVYSYKLALWLGVGYMGHCLYFLINVNVVVNIVIDVIAIK